MNYMSLSNMIRDRLNGTVPPDVVKVLADEAEALEANALTPGEAKALLRGSTTNAEMLARQRGYAKLHRTADQGEQT